MNIKSIIFADESSADFEFTSTVINEALGSLTDGTFAKSSIQNELQAGMKEIATAIKTEDIIAIFANEDIYHEAKNAICKAFKFEMIHNDDVLARLSVLDNSERYMMHALIPKNATAFPLSDGLFSGFAIRSKNQCIMFLPFSQDRTFISMKKYVFPYISRFSGEMLPSFTDYEVAYAARLLEDKLYETAAQIAISNTPVCKYIAHAAKQIECWPDLVSYAPYDKKNKATTADRLAAVKAAEYYECQFGASIIENEPDDSDCFSATITISNRQTATIRTISSIPDESHDDFMHTLVTEFFLMLAQELEKTALLSNDEIRHISPTSAVHGSHILLYIILFATAFFLTYVAASFSNLPIFS